MSMRISLVTAAAVLALQARDITVHRDAPAANAGKADARPAPKKDTKS